MSIDLNELKAVIKDSVRGELADKATASLETATAAASEARASGRDVIAELRKPAAKGEAGLAFARALKASMVGKATGRDAKDVAHGWAKEGHRHYAPVADAYAARAMSEGSLSAGGALVPGPVLGDFIEATYAATVALQMGARVLEMNRALDLGKMTSGATTYYVDELSNITPSQPVTAKVSLSAKKLAALVPVSNELLRNPSVGADMLVRDDLVRAVASRRDLSFFRGTGAAGQPKGMLYWAASGNQDNQSGTAIANKVADLMKLVRFVDESNVGLDAGMAGFVMAPRTKWALASTLDSQGNFVFAEMLRANSLFGFPVGVSTNIPTNLGGGGTESEVHFGLFSDALVAFDSSAPTQVETFANGAYYDGSSVLSGISNDSSVVRVIEGHDVALRHSNAWAVLNAVTWA